MKQTIADKIISKVSKGKVNTIHITREEMAELVDKYYIQNANTEAEYKAIWKVAKRGILLGKFLDSKDGNYQMYTYPSWGRLLHKYVWIYDKSENNYYEYEYYSYRKFKKTIKCKIAGAKRKI